MRYLSFLGMVWVALVCTTVWGRDPQAPAAAPLPVEFFRNLHAGKAQVVVTYGTSVTEYGPWVAVMKEWFEQHYPGKVNVINSGGSGQNSVWGLANVKQRVLEKHPDMVFIEFSINDAVTRFKVSVEDAVKNLDGMVKAIRAENPEVQIVLQTMNPTWDTPAAGKTAAGTAGSDRPHLDDYEQSYRDYAKANGLLLIDNYAGWVKLRSADPAKFQGVIRDGRHPDKNGILAVTWPNIKGVFEAAEAAAK